ncbi:MAG: HEPN domain-containing protein [Candidatus Omnitrophica bacterium]|nr:HEPN domain-containing protein [Candidatus Omnitrophota bacterium]
MKDWAEYLKKGLVKEQRPNLNQIEQQIMRAEKDLKTFKLVLNSDPEWACTISYQAMVRMGRALIFSYGYLPADGQQHKTVVEITGKLLGKKFDLLIQYFDRMRRNRNVFFYDSLDTNNEAQAKKAYETAVSLLKVVKGIIQEHNPQFQFKF